MKGPRRGSGQGPRIGAHMSIAGGMPEAIARARSVAASALQVFVKSSNQWAARPFAAGEAEAFRKAAAESDLDRFTVAHASYLINLASPDGALWEKSTAALAVELTRCTQLGIPWLVVHPGAHVGSGREAGIARIARALDEALAQIEPDGAGVLLEITAGQGSTIGSRFEDLAEIVASARSSDRLGACFDTCHALAAGYELRTDDGYAKTMDGFDRTIGLSRLRAIHLNDSKSDLGSRRDRHEHIGKGFLGLPAFSRIVNDPRFRDVPMVLETDKGEDLAEDRMNLAALRSVIES